MTTNATVIRYWLDGKFLRRKSMSLHTDGLHLISNNIVIGKVTDRLGKKVELVTPSNSKSMIRHFNLASELASQLGFSVHILHPQKRANKELDNLKKYIARGTLMRSDLVSLVEIVKELREEIDREKQFLQEIYNKLEQIK